MTVLPARKLEPRPMRSLLTTKVLLNATKRTLCGRTCVVIGIGQFADNGRNSCCRIGPELSKRLHSGASHEAFRCVETPRQGWNRYLGIHPNPAEPPRGHDDHAPVL